MVLEEIAASPLAGSGFGATIFIGRPGTTVQAKPRRYAENGYLWLLWKLGIPATAVLLAFLAVAIARRGRPPNADPTWLALRHGAQGALVALMIATFSFPSFNSLTITPIIGLLVVIAMAPDVVRRGPGEAAAGQVSGEAR
jgi:hypothetical protein